MTQEQQSFLNDKPLKLILKYSFPAVVALIINGMQSMIDGIFVGSFIGSSALASVNIATPYSQIVIGISMIASIGAQSQVGIYFGSGNINMAKDTFQTLLRTLSTLAILLSVLAFFFHKSFAHLLGANELLLNGSAIYIKTLSFFALPMCLMFYLGFLNRIVGKPQLYFYGSIISIIMNVTLNYLFLAKMHFGIAGAAMATGLSYTVALFIVAPPFFHSDSTLKIQSGHFNKSTILPVLYNGSSEGINSLSAAVVLFLFNKVLMKAAGAEGVAAFTAINYMGGFGSLLLFGICDGIGPIISYNYGAGRNDRVQKVMKLAFIGNFIFGLIIFSILTFFNIPLIQLFIRDNPDLVLFAANGAKLYAFTFLLSGFNVLSSGYFTFIGKGLQSAIIAGCRGLLFIVLGIIFLPKILGISGIWLSVPFAELTTFLIAICFLKKSFTFHQS